MKTISLFLCAFVIMFFSCSENKSAKQQAQESYEQTRTLLLEKEKKNPLLFLTVKGENRKNLIGQTVIKGKISSKATVATYKDIDIKIDFYSATKTLLESDKETIFVEITPGSSDGFKTKYFAPKGTDSVALTVEGAKTVN